MADVDPYSSSQGFAAEFNPYAPPTAELSPAAWYADGDDGIEPFSIRAVVNRAWRVYRRRMGLCMLVVATPMFLPTGFFLGAQAFVQFLAVRGAPAAQVTTVGITSIVVTIFLQVWLSTGQLLVLLRVSRGDPTRFEDVFRAGKFIFRIVIGLIVWSIAAMAFVFFFVFMGGILFAIARPLMGEISPLWWLVGIYLMVFGSYLLLPFVMARLIHYPLVVMDRDCGVIEAFQVSLRITRGRAAAIGVLTILAGFTGVLGVLACYVGIFFTFPLAYVIYACSYVSLAGPRSDFLPGKSAGINFLDVEQGLREALDVGPERRSDEFPPPSILPPTEPPDDPTWNR